jgi:hypothetical protein
MDWVHMCDAEFISVLKEGMGPELLQCHLAVKSAEAAAQSSLSHEEVVAMLYDKF